MEQDWINEMGLEPDIQWRIPLLGALLLHLLLFLSLPDRFMSADLSKAESDAVELTIVPEPAEKQPTQYVETNPDVPENEPDEANNYSARSQQAASPQPSLSDRRAPEVDGESEDSKKILQGAVEAAEPLPPGVYSNQGVGEGNNGGVAGGGAPVVSPPPPAFLNEVPESTDGTGSRLQETESEAPAEEYADGKQVIDLYRQNTSERPGESAKDGDGEGGAPEGKPVPRPRPRLPPELTHGPLAKSHGAFARRGSIALDATFSEFGEYEQQFYAALQAGWYQEIEFFQPIDTHSRVVVRFKIRSDGTILDTQVVSTNASEIATIICESAITKRSPFRPWTEEMVQVFGHERVLTVAFHYR